MARPRYGVGGGRGGDHQARTSQDPVAAPCLDRLIDGGVAAEIIGTDDQPPLCNLVKQFLESAGHLALAQELEELSPLAHPATHHLWALDHLGH